MKRSPHQDKFAEMTWRIANPRTKANWHPDAITVIPDHVKVQVCPPTQAGDTGRGERPYYHFNSQRRPG